ncbi:MAG: heparinase II/III family protein [Tannerellaceae bacterium]|jgi:hypothetical protein|nr:heparinase II/III family protein [Tannerellaceae bacterium]
MGFRYVAFRLLYEIKRKTGILKRKYPITIDAVQLDLSDWKASSKPFFFQSREELNFKKNPNETLKHEVEHIINGRIQFFSYQYFNLGLNDEWITNPDTGYKYDTGKHWTAVEDYGMAAGDIKYVWEKSRFSYLYTVIRYDYHFDEDHSEFVFQQIEDWIEKNPLNCGPNYKCSQEISLRLLNWLFILYYYKNSIYLTEVLFDKIIRSIYWQLHHVYSNINFSKIAVRNNHAITETLTLYIVSTLFPQFPNASEWKRKGKKWFEEEINYQIYDDGAYLQFSMNYHRVVVQLLTWAIRIADLNNELFAPVIYEKAYKSIRFLYQFQESSNGYLPNYGSNDGALFFKLSGNDYRDYRPQLDALHFLLTGNSLYENIYEDICWYGTSITYNFKPIIKEYGIIRFEIGGYYLIREKDTLTFIRCGKHNDRPAHADNLHIDIWHKGENILIDSGSYKYNTDRDTLKYFMGTASHNTVILDNYDQMLKGERFIWYYRSQALNVNIYEDANSYYFEGTISCFTYLNRKIKHRRSIRKIKHSAEWIVEDVIENMPYNSLMRQLWHTDSESLQTECSDITPLISSGQYSPYYGYKQRIKQIEFATKNNRIKTLIRII